MGGNVIGEVTRGAPAQAELRLPEPGSRASALLYPTEAKPLRIGRRRLSR
jgi:hypothetical protein